MGRSIIITTGGGTDVEDGNPNATADKVLSGYTFYNRVDDPILGTMTNQSGGQDQTLNPSGSYTIPKGYHPGTQKIKTVTLASQTEATASVGCILDSKTGWKSGSKITGTMANKGKVTGTLGANGTYTIPAGWHNGQGSVAQSLSAQAASNVTPGTAQKTVIAASKWASGAQTVLGNSNLAAGNIKKDVTIFGVKGTFAIDPSAVLAGGASTTGLNVIGVCGVTFGSTSSSSSGASSRRKAYWNQYCRFPPVIEGGALRLFSWHADQTDGRWVLGTFGGGSFPDGGTDKYGNPSFTENYNLVALRNPPNLSSSDPKIKIKIEYAKWSTSKAEDPSATGQTVGFTTSVYLGIWVKNNNRNAATYLDVITRWAYGGDSVPASDIQRTNVPFTIENTLSLKNRLNSTALAQYNSASASNKVFYVALYHGVRHKWKKTGAACASGVFDSWFWVKNLFVSEA